MDASESKRRGAAPAGALPLPGACVSARKRAGRGSRRHDPSSLGPEAASVESPTAGGYLVLPMLKTPRLTRTTSAAPWPGALSLAALLAAGCGDDTTTETAAPTTTSSGVVTTSSGSTVDTTADASASSSDSPPTGETTATTTPVDVTSGPGDTGTGPGTSTNTDTTTAGATTDTTGTTGPEGTDTGATSGSSGELGETAGSGETGGNDTDDAYDGELCGNLGTGPLALGSLSLAVQFAPSNGGPNAFAGWVTTTKEIRAAVYDIDAGSWSDPVTLQTDYASEAPRAAVDGQGNAVLAYVMKLPQWHVVVQHYDAVAETWKLLELPGDFVKLRIGGLTVSPGGHAVLSVYDNVGPNQDTRPVAWFYDPVAEAWSDPTVYPVVQTLFTDETLRWAQDPATGDAALTLNSDDILLQHHDAATDTLTSTVVNLVTHVHQVGSIGGGEFIAMSDTSALNAYGQILAFHYDGVDWQPPEDLGASYGVAPVRIVGTTDGRAVGSWSDAKGGAHARMFDHDEGWAELLTAKDTNAMAQSAFNDHRVALDGDGFRIVLSSYGLGAKIRTFSRRYDGLGWDALVELDPQQPLPYSRVKQVVGLGDDRARALWTRDEENTVPIHVYACHTPMAGWSAPTTLPQRVVRFEDRPDGAALVMTAELGNPRAEYFAPN